MGDRFAERRLRGEAVVNVNWIEVAGEPREVDDVCLGHRAPHRLPLASGLEVLEVQVSGGERHLIFDFGFRISIERPIPQSRLYFSYFLFNPQSEIENPKSEERF